MKEKGLFFTHVKDSTYLFDFFKEESKKITKTGAKSTTAYRIAPCEERARYGGVTRIDSRVSRYMRPIAIGGNCGSSSSGSSVSSGGGNPPPFPCRRSYRLSRVSKNNYVFNRYLPACSNSRSQKETTADEKPAIKIIVYTIYGKPLIEIDKNELDLSKLPSGTYIIKATIDNKTITTRIFK